MLFNDIVGCSHLKYPFGYVPLYLKIIPLDALPEVSAIVGNITPFIATLPLVESKLIPPLSAGFTMFKSIADSLSFTLDSI